MSSGHEIEIKFKIAAVRQITSKLGAAGFRLVTERTHEMNTLYDLSGEPLRSRGALLRLREYGEKWTLTYKDKSAAQGRHKSRREVETVVENGPAVAEIFSALGFRPAFAYEKFRSEWTDGVGHVVIDETPIGNFGEIEGPPEWIDQTAKQLGIAERQYITCSYSELFLQWKQETGRRAGNMTFAELEPKGFTPA